MRRPRSLQALLAWRLALVMVASVAFGAGAVAWRTLRVAQELEHAALQTRAADIAESVVAGPTGELTLRLSPALTAAYFAAGRRDIYVVRSATGKLIGESAAGVAARLAPFLPPHGGYFVVPPQGGFHQGLVGYVLADDRVQVVVASGHEPEELLVQSLGQDLVVRGLWLLALIGAAAVGISVLTIRRGLAPLRRASAIAGRIGPAETKLRLPEENLPREVVPLIAAINRALARLEQGIEEQRRFAADAAHQLRTPLAVLTARLDQLHGEAAETLRHDADRMNRIVDQLLKLARLDAVPLDTASRVPLRAAALEVIDQFAPLAIPAGRDITLAETMSGAAIRGNHWALVMALGNLVENALAHTPAGSAVEIRINADGFTVADRGPGVPEASRQTIFRRFASLRAGSAGAGLGLAIVSQIAATHDGTVEVADRPGGGTEFTLRVGAGRVLC